MLTKIKKQLGAFKQNLGGWSTNRKIVVIESDDWGSIRMPDQSAFNELIKKGIPVNKCPFLTYDGCEQLDDLDYLFKSIEGIQKDFGKAPVITANYIMANPDFSAIKTSNYLHYHYCSLEQKLKDEGIKDHYQSMVAKGLKHNWFQPQLHGREHVNIPLWLLFLQNNSNETRLAFDQGVYGISTTISKEKRRSYLAALDYENKQQFDEYIKKSLVEGSELFKDFFGFISRSFIAPNYTWDDSVELVLNDLKVEFLQSSRNQLISLGGQKDGKKFLKHKTGETNNMNQIYIVRNAIFEPAIVKNKQKHLDECLNQIAMSFLTRKPAVISSHRLNFMGSLDVQNRSENSQLFEQLIKKVITKWPDVEFMSTVQLGDIIKQDKHD